MNTNPVIKETSLAIPSQEISEFQNHFFDGEKIGIEWDNGICWLNATQVCSILGYANLSQTIKDHCLEEGVKKIIINNKKDLFISEANLYRLTMRSKKPSAIAFEKWVVEEILPSIRKTGKYIRRTLTLPPAETSEQLPSVPTAPAEPAVSFKSTLNYALPKPLVGEMIEARKRLLEKGKEFPSDKDFLAYMLNKAMVSMGFLPPEDDDA